MFFCSFPYRRRPGEVCEATYENYRHGKINDVSKEENILGQMSDFEKQLANDNLLIKIVGKTDKIKT